uniref:K Homology domain-containing protein n=2 Tax=Kalanchoe fedtschenkoi TaxID=63787 RepID=A0A7N1A9Q8_KALFE
MKVDQASSPQTSKSVTPKISMFGVKSGFVIPKNKLSGSLVPVFRVANKSAKSGSVTDQNKQLASRKTKWGPDLTQDAFVRKGRLLAYQTRVDQIAKLIGMRDPETEAGQDVDMESRDANQESSHYEIDAEELEKREIIGEILKLNPSYKAPSDYVPLLKEAQVPLPIKDYPGYNFLGLIYGSGSDTLKRLEKETGAKIQVFGKKKDCPEKVEITSDAKKNQDDYEELYALISADTYGKVDAAVSLVELLVTPVSASGSTLSVSNAPIMGQSSEPPSGLPNAAGEGVMQQLVRPQQIFQGQFQYNSPAPGPSHPAQLLGSQMTPGGMVPTVGTSPLTSDPSPFPSAPQSQGQFPMQPYISGSHTFGQTGSPRYPLVVAPPTFPSQPNIANVHQFSGSQPTPIGMSSLVRPLVTSLPQSAPGHPIRSQLNQDGSSAGWPRPPVPTPNSTMVGASASAQGQQNTAFGMAQTVPLHPGPPAFLLPSNVNQGAATNTYIAPSPQVR